MSKKIEYVLTRTDFTEKSTVGELTLDAKHICFVLEDKVRAATEAKVFGKTAIPYGRYQIIITESTRFKRLLPLLVDVPGYAGIRIHTGNSDVDTEGCLIVGTSKSTDWVSGSKDAFAVFYPELEKQIAAGNTVYITIKK